jgi:hypothetical protein
MAGKGVEVSMKYWIIGALSVLAMCVYFTLKTSGLCVWCPTYTCYGSCPSGCVCVTGPGQIGGHCYGVENSSKFEDMGYSVK